MIERTYRAGERSGLSPRRIADAVRADAALLWSNRFVLRNIVVSQLAVRYQRSSLGFLWTLLHPALMLTVLAVVFSHVMRVSIDRYVVYLFSGMIPFQMLAGAMENGGRSMLLNESLIRKAPIQKLVFPVGDVLVATVNLLFATAALLVILLIFGGARLHATIVIAPAALALLMVFTLGVVLIAMTLVTLFRDFEHMISVVLQALYFCTPILYMREQLPEWTRRLIGLNPMTQIVELFHHAYYHGAWPGAEVWAAAAGAALGALLVGYLVYKVYEHEYIFRL